MEAAPLAIETHALSLDWGRGAGVRDVDLAVRRGEIFGFLGPNGAGKTTTIRMLLDLLRPDRGSAAVLGIPVRQGGGELRRRLGFLPGDLALPPGLTGEQTLALFSRLEQRPPKRCDETLDRLGFPRAALTRRTQRYSTGMRQMIGITLALQHEPELLILDEPTSGLDPLVRDSFLGLLRDCRARGQTVFLSSHVLDEVERVADRVAIVHGGTLRRVVDLADPAVRGRKIVTLRFRDGHAERSEEFETSDEPEKLLAELARRATSTPVGGAALADFEVRSAGLERLFRETISSAAVATAAALPDRADRATS